MPKLLCAIPITEPDPELAVLRWFTLLGQLCAAIDYDTCLLYTSDAADE